MELGRTHSLPSLDSQPGKQCVHAAVILQAGMTLPKSANPNHACHAKAALHGRPRQQHLRHDDQVIIWERPIASWLGNCTRNHVAYACLSRTIFISQPALSDQLAPGQYIFDTTDHAHSGRTSRYCRTQFECRAESLMQTLGQGCEARGLTSTEALEGNC